MVTNALNPPDSTGRTDQPILWIGEFLLDLHLRSLSRGTEKIRITPRPFGTLEYLVKNRHRVVSKAELLEKVWGGQREISAVEHVIGELRRSLGDNPDAARYIETVPGQGYRLVAEVRAAVAVQTAQAPAVDTEPATGTVPGTVPAAQARGHALRHFRFGWIALGLVAALGACFGTLALVRHHQTPVVRRVVMNGTTLTALGAAGDVLWTSELDSPWMERFEGEDDSTWRTQIVDLEGNGVPEVLVAAPSAPDEDKLLCFSPRGKVLWRYRAPIQVRFGTWDVSGPWRLRQMMVASENGSGSIYLVVTHPVWWPSFVVRISPSGASRVVFANSGNVRALGQFRMASGNYILAAGINNEYGQASLAILRQDGPPATSPQGDAVKYLCTRGCPPERPYRYILFPRSELNMASEAPYNFAVAIHSRTNGVTVGTRELSIGWGLGEFYDFSQELQPERVADGDGYREIHRLFEKEGRIKHSFEQCPTRKAPAILRICDENGNWSTVSVPRSP
jgi:DNA-binding winged helix-turn-helix (wHTH) protein